MSEQVGSVTCKKSSDFHGGIRFQSRFTIRWELEDKSFLKIDIICLDDSLKEQYPVSAHAPNFDFWTGCREIKRCEESKRTLKNPSTSRLAGINTTLKLLRSTDQ